MSTLFLFELLSGAEPGASPELLAQGTAMRDAVLADLLALPGLAVTCADAGRRAPAPGCRMAAPEAGEDAVAFVRRVAAAHDAAWIIAPESGRMLATLRAAVGESRWIGCDAAAIRTASSKRATIERLNGAGIPTPAQASAPTRWVVKPDDGAGCIDTRVHADRGAALADMTHRPGTTIEPYVDGEPLSISVLAGHGSAHVLAVNRQRIEIDADGLLQYRGVDVAALDRAHDPRLPPLRGLARQVLHALPGLRGFVGIDVVWHPATGGVVIEVNPRVTCAYPGLSAYLGINLAGAVLQSRRPAAPPARRRTDLEEQDDARR